MVPSPYPRASATESSDEWTEITVNKGPLRAVALGEVWNFRELAWYFALRDVKVRYKQTFLGVAWVVLGPLLVVALFNGLLGRIEGLPSDGLPYPVFLFSGFIIWTYVSAAVTNASSRLVDAPDLVTKVYFPRLIAPLAGVMPPLLDLAITLVVLAVFLFFYDVRPGIQVLLLPVWIAAASALAFAVGVWFSALNVQYRDLRHAWSFIMQLWFFSSPVVFAASVVEGPSRWLYALNPVVGLLEGFRWSVVDGAPPTAYSLVSLAVGVAVLVSGVLYFQRVERRFADVI